MENSKAKVKIGNEGDYLQGEYLGTRQVTTKFGIKNVLGLRMENSKATVKFGNEGDYLQGEYLGTRQVTTKFGLKNVMSLRLEDTNCSTLDRGQEVAVNAGDLVGAFPTPALFAELSKQQIGSKIRITLAKLVSTGKPQPFKKFHVEAL